MVIYILVQGIYTLNCYLCVCMVKIIVSIKIGGGTCMCLHVNLILLGYGHQVYYTHTHTQYSTYKVYIFNIFIDQLSTYVWNTIQTYINI